MTEEQRDLKRQKLGNSIKALSAHKASLALSASRLENKIKDLEEKLREKEYTDSNLDEKISNKFANLKNLDTQLAEARARAEVDIKELEQEKDKKVKRLQKEIKELDKSILRSLDEVSKCNKLLEDVKISTQRKVDDYKNLKDLEFNEAKKRIEEWELEIQAKEASVAKKEQLLAANSKKLKAFKKALEEVHMKPIKTVNI